MSNVRGMPGRGGGGGMLRLQIDMCIMLLIVLNRVE